MRPIVTVALTVALALTASTTDAGDGPKGEVPEAVLAKMGLAGMTKVSDREGHQIRGKQFLDAVALPLNLFGGGGTGGNGDDGGGGTTVIVLPGGTFVQQNAIINQFQVAGGDEITTDGDGGGGGGGQGGGPTFVNFGSQGAGIIQQFGDGTASQAVTGRDLTVSDQSRLFSLGNSFSGRFDEIKF